MENAGIWMHEFWFSRIFHIDSWAKAWWIPRSFDKSIGTFASGFSFSDMDICYTFLEYFHRTCLETWHLSLNEQWISKFCCYVKTYSLVIIYIFRIFFKWRNTSWICFNTYSVLWVARSLNRLQVKDKNLDKYMLSHDHYRNYAWHIFEENFVCLCYYSILYSQYSYCSDEDQFSSWACYPALSEVEIFWILFFF